MEWLIVAAIGLAIGMVVSFIAQDMRIPQLLTMIIGVVGALAGAYLDRMTGFATFGPWTFYVAGTIVSIGFLTGAALAFELTNEEKRV